MIHTLLRHRFGWVVLSLAFVLLTGACADITELVAPPPPTMIIDDIRNERIPPALPRLIVNLGPYPDTLDPQKSGAGYDSETTTLRLIYEGLTRLNEKLETVPGAAESWTYNFDATTLTFHLRPDLKYSDGTLLNAKRFEYALVRNIDPATAGENASLTNDIIGAEEWQAADIFADDFDRTQYVAALGIEALDTAGWPCQQGAVGYAQADCLTLRLKFRQPAPYFHTIMNLWIAYPAKEESIRDGDENWWNTAQYQVGNGPFRLITVEPFVRQELVPNPYYHGAQPQYYLEFRYVTDPAVALEAYKNDELDIIATDVSQLTAINADDNLKAQHRVYPASCTMALKFGLQTQFRGADGQTHLSPFHDQKVREAFAYAFDADGWAREVDRGLSLPASSWIPPGYPFHVADEVSWKFDPEKARAALAQSSYRGPEELNKLGLKLAFSDAPRNRERAEWLIKNYKQNLGVDLSYDPIEPTATMLSKAPKFFPLLAHQGWCGDYPDPQNWLSVYWKSDVSYAQRQGYKNDQFDRLIQEADAETNPALRMELYRQAQHVLIQDVPAIFAYHTTNHYLVKPWVKGIVQTPEDGAWPGSIVPTSITIERSVP